MGCFRGCEEITILPWVLYVGFIEKMVFEQREKKQFEIRYENQFSRG